MNQFTDEQIRVAQADFMTRVYTWMSGALAITGLIAMWVASTPELIISIVGNKLLFYGLLIGELLVVGYLSARVHRMSVDRAITLFIAYAIMNGLTLSVFFIAYTSESIASTFFITAGTFGAMSLYGYYTKTDLTSIGNIAFMALIGLIIASVVNIFFQNEMLYWVTTYVGVLIFVGLTAYDTQKLKRMSLAQTEGTDENQKGAIMGALTLYLDFINLFIFLLRIFGNRK